jgi:hypothetical protein
VNIVLVHYENSKTGTSLQNLHSVTVAHHYYKMTIASTSIGATADTAAAATLSISY